MLSFFTRLFSLDPSVLFNRAVADFVRMEERLMVAARAAENRVDMHLAEIKHHEEEIAAHSAVMNRAHEIAAKVRDFIDRRL